MVDVQEAAALHHERGRRPMGDGQANLSGVRAAVVVHDAGNVVVGVRQPDVDPARLLVVARPVVVEKARTHLDPRMLERVDRCAIGLLEPDVNDVAVFVDLDHGEPGEGRERIVKGESAERLVVGPEVFEPLVGDQPGVRLPIHECAVPQERSFASRREGPHGEVLIRMRIRVLVSCRFPLIVPPYAEV